MKLITLAVCLALAAPAFAHQKGDWLVRAGATSVVPDDSSGNVFVGGTDLGLGVEVDNSTQLGLNIAYFFADNWNIEVLAATPFSHDIDLEGVGPLAEADQLPPSLTANYFFGTGALKPYVGAGVNYTIFFDEQFTGANRDAGFSNLDLDSSFGLTFQAGFDYKFNDKWLINGSVRWIDIDTDATFDLNGTSGSVSVDVDPLVYTLSIGYVF